MRSLLVALAVSLVAGRAAANEGPQVGIQAGYGFWNLAPLRDKLAGPGGVGPTFANQLVDPRNVSDGGVYVIQIGYNILGHVAAEAQLTIHPWSVFDSYTCPASPDCTAAQKDEGNQKDHPRRGGFGVASGIVTYYPLQSLIRPDRTFDVSLYAGIGYGIFGGGKPIELGMDGVVTELGGTLEVYPAPWISLGVTPRFYLLDMHRFIVNYNERDHGGAMNTPDAHGGNFIAITGSIVLHFQPVQQTYRPNEPLR